MNKNKSRQLAQLNRMKRGHLSFFFSLWSFTTPNHFLNRTKNHRPVSMCRVFVRGEAFPPAKSNQRKYLNNCILFPLHFCVQFFLISIIESIWKSIWSGILPSTCSTVTLTLTGTCLITIRRSGTQNMCAKWTDKRIIYARKHRRICWHMLWHSAACAFRCDYSTALRQQDKMKRESKTRIGCAFYKSAWVYLQFKKIQIRIFQFA